MKLLTKYFGEIEYDAGDAIAFPAGLFGFEEEHEFLLLPFEGSAGSLLCFQSTRTPALAFVAMDPFSLQPDYRPALSGAELRELGAENI
ncbi:MAG: flagellar assembly protein FliW, partial [Roseburia sp.]|nr:flagellar assembly protein FliW [Roseburia sp.]